MYVQKRHWLDYDPVAIVVLVIGIGMIELLAMILTPIGSNALSRGTSRPHPRGVLHHGCKPLVGSSNLSPDSHGSIEIIRCS
jgi:hypothetical protein